MAVGGPAYNNAPKCMLSYPPTMLKKIKIKSVGKLGHFYFQSLFAQAKLLFFSSSSTTFFVFSPLKYQSFFVIHLLYMSSMDTLTTSSSLSDDYTASRQADTIEAGSILISLANSHKPASADIKQELESMPKHHSSYSLEDRHSLPLPPTAPHSNDHEV
jgi:hypothetical protein